MTPSQDRLDTAIAAARSLAKPAAPKADEPRLLGTIRLESTGRIVQINFPADLTDAELLDLAGGIATHMRAQVTGARAKKPAGRLLVPFRG